MKYDNNYYLGLDIGTDSVGYAVTDTKYNLLKFHGEPAWGTTIFDAASLCDERRMHRTARRRLDRRQQRVALIQELFAPEIAKVDARFYIRQKESQLFRSDSEDAYTLFNDENFNDRDYSQRYPTIHHLILDLMTSDEPHDVRLVYLACSWLVAHRGHFLSSINVDNLEAFKDLTFTYQEFVSYFINNGYSEPWTEPDISKLGEILREKAGVTVKTKELITLILHGDKPSKKGNESFPYSQDSIIKLLAGGTAAIKDLYDNEEYADLGSVSLCMDEEKLEEIIAALGDEGELLCKLKKIADWSVLADIMNNYSCISEAKIGIYNQHKKDLSDLKYIIKKYAKNQYATVFRNTDVKNNYVAYSHHSNGKSTVKGTGIIDHTKFLKGILKGIVPDAADKTLYNRIMEALDNLTFLPKQKTVENRVIPYQLYLYELKALLRKCETYLPFLKETDDTGLTVSEKIESVFVFKIPYFVGPLNSNSKYAWIIRKPGKIYPWNFDNMVDLDASEQAFIQKLTNYCTYLPDQPVLPKDSLLYHKYMVLNEINNIRINGERIEPELKQAIYTDLFMNVKKVTVKRLHDYLICNGIIAKGEEDSVTGIDININSNLAPQIAFRKLLDCGELKEYDVERIIERASYAEDKSRLRKWLDINYPNLRADDRKYICQIKINGFGRLSRKFLAEFEGVNKETGEVTTIIGALWTGKENLMEILSDKYTFKDQLKEYLDEYYSENPKNLQKKLDDMYVSNAVKRPIFRTLAILKDIESAFGKPKKIFIETTRNNNPDSKGKRTSSRKHQILDLYKKCMHEDVKLLKQQLEAMGEYADNRLQSDKLFLYYMQLGKSMYSGKSIDLDKLGTKLYDIDHIYPQSVVKDDSIINNKVLVLSEENGQKSDTYPINASIRNNMTGFWRDLKDDGLISEEKYRRLIRTTPFSDNERFGFINRQLTETSQAAKAIAEVLKGRYDANDVEIVYNKAGLVSDFRHEFDFHKSRLFNDLHHAEDAYLNIVVGNVYSMKFTKKWFNISSNYSMKTKTIFSRPLQINGETIWDGETSIGHVRKVLSKNNAHFTKFSYFKTGGLFDDMPCSKNEGLVPRKKELPSKKYGGYNKASVMFYIPVKYYIGKKSEIIIMSVEIPHGDRFLTNHQYAKEYSFIRLKHILGKAVDRVEFPMGFRPWKVNTMLSLDGFLVCITAIGGGGRCLTAQPVTQFAADPYWKYYLKKVEVFVEKTKRNPNYIYDETFDKVSKGKNEELYRLYCSKYEDSIFKKRVNPPTEILVNGADMFNSLDVKEQCQVLVNIHSTFTRNSSGGCDLSAIGGTPHSAATVNFSSTIKNWKKKYKRVTIIDQSVSGLWKKESENLLDF